MSEVFDPEKVERFNYDDIHGFALGETEFVNASAYDSLLALYREAKDEIEGLYQDMAGASL